MKAETLADKFPRIDFEGVKHTAMKRTVLLALAAGLATSTLVAQTAAPAGQPSAPPAAPQAVPAKVAIIGFQTGLMNTNAAQRALSDLAKKYETQKTKLTNASNEIESLKKQLNALKPDAPDDQRKNLITTIDAKEKQLNLDAEQAQNSYNDDLEKQLGPIQQAFGNAAVKYCQDNGFTMLLSPETAQQQGLGPILWWAQTSDVTVAVVNAYNASSGVAAPPSAPAATAPRPRPTAPAAPRK